MSTFASGVEACLNVSLNVSMIVIVLRRELSLFKLLAEGSLSLQPGLRCLNIVQQPLFLHLLAMGEPTDAGNSINGARRPSVFPNCGDVPAKVDLRLLCPVCGILSMHHFLL